MILRTNNAALQYVAHFRRFGSSICVFRPHPHQRSKYEKQHYESKKYLVCHYFSLVEFKTFIGVSSHNEVEKEEASPDGNRDWLSRNVVISRRQYIIIIQN